jgi:hypothetical protein
VIKGEKEEQKEEKDARMHRTERSYGTQVSAASLLLLTAGESRSRGSGRRAAMASGRRGLLVRWILVSALAMLTVRAPAAEECRISGTIADVATNRVALDEVGPWGSVADRPLTTRRVLDVEPSTRVAVAHREPDAASGFPGDFVMKPAALGDLHPGDFVTAECTRAGGRLTAVTLVTVQSSE